MFDKLVTKVNTIDTNEFVLKTQYNTGKSVFGKKINAYKKILILVDKNKNRL